MNQIQADMKLPTTVQSQSSSIAPAGETRRLVVVILDVEQEAFLAGRILELAGLRGLPVVLLGISPDAGAAGELRRRLITIAAFIRDGCAVRGVCAFPIEIQVEQGKGWLVRLRSSVQPQDRVASYSERKPSAWERPIAEILATGLQTPVYGFSALRTTAPGQQSMASAALSWLGSAACIGGFVLLQVRIVNAVQGSTQTALLLLTLVAEAGLLWLVNSVFSLT